MPHQCLKCGSIIKSGSSDILKGCSKCGGKKFFFITQPVSDNERQRILDKVERERENLMTRANENFERLMQEAQDKQLDGERLTDRDLKEMIKDSWVKVDGTQTDEQAMKKEFVDRPQGLLRPDIPREPEIPVAKPEVPVKAPAPDLVPAKEVKEHKPPKVKETPKEPKKGKKGEKKGKAEETREKPAKLGMGPKDAKKGGKKAGKQSEKEAPKAKPEAPMQKFKDTMKAAKEKKKSLSKAGRDYPAVINVKEKGVYEIDVKALMEDSPIIVQSDGTYLLHLQSIFEKAQKRAEKALKKKNA